MAKRSESKIDYRLKVIIELEDEGVPIYQENPLNVTAVDKAALKHRLKVYRSGLRKKLKERYPGALLKQMDFLLEDGTKILAKGKGRERRERKEKSKRALRQEDRRIASGKFTIIEDE